ncbi:citryl-CoA lyase [Sphingomonas sp. Leaf33]|uniref:HpcH/HpaI aldolase/citrate lyase family protein n=1 Tax=Sphingomonas sp. Leaf33 TaxID=1736215 RepID=UPI0007018265|nr:CoA ester lyase [Sphingomonas sp. Leaf33]KQN26253.1 citryl-CoA lyase [Sphingomonas sp. Leaf33]
MTTPRLAPRSLLFLPASNLRAIARARTLATDAVLLDLEDAVADDAKVAAREAAVVAVGEGFAGTLAAIRVNAIDHPEHAADVAAVAGSAADIVVLPKVEHPDAAATVASASGKPLLAMIETPRGVLAAAAIAAQPGVIGLIAGTNDLRATLRLPPTAPRDSLSHALQAIVLAARAHDAWAFDGVYNRLADADGFAAEARMGRDLGFDGKTLIHPSQVESCNAAFGPTSDEIEDARALIAAFTGGAERFRDRMIEGMHIDQARALLARAGD